MGTVAEKLTYLKETKETIAKAIEEKEVTVPSSTPFRDYAKLIEQIQGGAGNLQAGTVMPTGEEFTAYPDEGFGGFSSVTVSGDANLIPENIRKGTTVYGKTGQLEPGASEKDVPPPLDYQVYVEEAKKLYTGDYAGMVIFDNHSSTVGVCFLMDNFEITAYSEESTELYMLGAYYCRYTKSTGAWDSLDYRSAASTGGHFAANIQFSSRVLYYGAIQVWPRTGAANIYGVEWDGTETTKLTRTDAATGFADPVAYAANVTNYGSPFDNLMPWAGMTVSERVGGTMVAIPRFWYKLTQNDKAIKIQIADSPVAGFHVSPAHMDRGDGKGERAVVYVGRYLIDSVDFKSTTGKTSSRLNFDLSTSRQSIHSVDENTWMYDFAMLFTIWLLYLVEYANWNSMAAIGPSNTPSAGYTDQMPYHTGYIQSRAMQYRYIEHMWCSSNPFVDGCYMSELTLYIILNPSEFSDSIGGIPVGQPANGFTTELTVVNSNALFPVFISSAATTDLPSAPLMRWSITSVYPVVVQGGGGTSQSGLTYMSIKSTSSKGYSRNMELP